MIDPKPVFRHMERKYLLWRTVNVRRRVQFALKGLFEVDFMQ